MEITVEDGPQAEVAMTGEADADNCHEIGKALLDRTYESVSMNLDLGELTFIDSSAISELLRVHSSLAERGIVLTITDTSAAVRRVLEITGLLQTFGVSETH